MSIFGELFIDELAAGVAAVYRISFGKGDRVLSTYDRQQTEKFFAYR